MRNWHALVISFLFVAAGLFYGWAQQIGPSGINGCVYLVSPSVPTNLQSLVNICDATGRLRVAGLGGCSASNTFISRTSGLSPTESNAYTAMICGMITDGVGCSAWTGFSGAAGTGLDALYIFATNTRTTAYLNLCSTSYGLTENAGTATFTADQGITGTGGPCLDTGFIPSSAPSPNYVLNGASLGVYVFSGVAGSAEIGSNDTQGSYIAANVSGNNYYAINEPAGVGPNMVSTGIPGSYLSTRTGATLNTLYKNEVSVATDATMSTTVPTASIFILGRDLGGGVCGIPGSDLVAAAFIGGAQSAANAVKVQSRINAYMTALGRNVY